MKYIIAVIKPERVNEVLHLLEDAGVNLATVTNVVGRGRQKGLSHQYRGLKAVSTLINKAKLEIAVNDEYADAAVEAIQKGARTEEIGDGKIFIVDLQECVRIRTGEVGAAAIG